MTRERAAAAGTSPVSRRVVGLALAMMAGFALAVQSRVNGELGRRLQDGTAAAIISFGTGLLLLILLVPARPAGRRSLHRLRQALRDGTVRPWHLLGGLSGAFLVAVQGFTVAAIGVAGFTVAVVAGQTTSGLAVDRAGLGPGGRQPVTPARLVGTVLAVLAVLLSVADRLGDPSALGLAVLPAVAGFGLAWQQAANGLVGVASGSVLSATFVNFLAGSVALLIAYAVQLAVRDRPGGSLPGEAWLYVGGPLGIMVIAIAAAVVRATGVLLLGLAIVAGQVIGAVLLDLVSPAAASRPQPYTLLGAALTLLAVIVASARPGRRARF